MIFGITIMVVLFVFAYFMATSDDSRHNQVQIVRGNSNNVQARGDITVHSSNGKNYINGKEVPNGTHTVDSLED